MATKERKPLGFDLEASPKTAPQNSTVADKQQVGARITTSKYRQLKSRAALDGVSVQTLVEQAIDMFLASK